MADRNYYEGIGRRKTSSARVRIYPGGSGEFLVNDKAASEFFSREGDLNNAVKALEMVDMVGKMDITVHVAGGGVNGQTDAVRLGLARALIKFDETLRPELRKAGLLTRDARAVERKKPGLKKARKAPTYTKR